MREKTVGPVWVWNKKHWQRDLAFFPKLAVLFRGGGGPQTQFDWEKPWVLLIDHLYSLFKQRPILLVKGKAHHEWGVVEWNDLRKVKEVPLPGAKISPDSQGKNVLRAQENEIPLRPRSAPTPPATVTPQRRPPPR
eukprot:FR738156.1.p1 GENE.FR738156.1~~FR738156.1.p1  ORF type:complete len:136 (+),score=28.43 FR738156.1:243-650(+)